MKYILEVTKTTFDLGQVKKKNKKKYVEICTTVKY